jgi:hypothetical protein
MDEFERDLNAPPAQRWEHDPNPLVGELIARYTYDGGEFDPAEMLIIQPDGSDTAFSVLCGKATLRTFVEHKDPKVGGQVGLKFRGDLVSRRNGKSYADYAAAYKPAEPQSENGGGGGGDDELPF